MIDAAEKKRGDLEGTIGSEEEFYSNVALTKEKEQLDEMLNLGDVPGAENEDTRKNNEQDIKDADQKDKIGLDNALSQEIDIEAENQELIDRQLDEALNKGAKADLDSRLKQAAEDAKAKGKKTVRTFDMLRKAISGDAEQRKQEEKERERKKVEQDADDKAKAKL